MAYIGNNIQTQGFTPAIDYFSGNGSTVTFTLSRPVASVAQMIVAIDNVIQNPSSAFTVSGNAITFTSAPLSGTNNIWVEYTSLITTYNAISQDPSVIGDITASGGYLSTGDFGNTFTDGTIVDYVTGMARITTGPADGLTIYNGGTSARAALMTLNSSGNMGIGTTSPTVTGLEIAKSLDPIVRLTDNRGPYYFDLKMGGATASVNNVANGPMTFGTNNTERMRIDSSGNLLVGTTSTAVGTSVASGINLVKSDLTSAFGLGIQSNTTSGTQFFVGFARGANTGVCGYISSSATNSTNYTTSSDYRLKENIAPMIGALDKVSALKPVTYTWKEDGSSGQGFIAHELQAVVPQCVTGEKDAVDEEGNPKYQGIDTSFLVATLTAAIQEQQAIIEDLKARIETLEAK